MVMLATTPVTEATVTVNGVDVKYFDSETETSRMPVVLLHGTSGSTDIQIGRAHV